MKEKQCSGCIPSDNLVKDLFHLEKNLKTMLENIQISQINKFLALPNIEIYVNNCCCLLYEIYVKTIFTLKS